MSVIRTRLNKVTLAGSTPRRVQSPQEPVVSDSPEPTMDQEDQDQEDKEESKESKESKEPKSKSEPKNPLLQDSQKPPKESSPSGATSGKKREYVRKEPKK